MNFAGCGCEVHGSVNVRGAAVFWDMTWCSLVEVPPTFQTNLLPAFSGQKNKPAYPSGSREREKTWFAKSKQILPQKRKKKK
jgi:hypothetical protein